MSSSDRQLPCPHIALLTDIPTLHSLHHISLCEVRFCCVCNAVAGVCVVECVDTVSWNAVLRVCVTVAEHCRAKPGAPLSSHAHVCASPHARRRAVLLLGLCERVLVATRCVGVSTDVHPAVWRVLFSFRSHRKHTHTRHHGRLLQV